VVAAAGAFGSTAKLAMENAVLGGLFTWSSEVVFFCPPRPDIPQSLKEKAVPMAFRKTLRALALPKASTGFGGRSSQGSHTITVFGATGMTGKKAIVFGRNTTKIKKK
jgi:hypothetical protein